MAFIHYGSISGTEGTLTINGIDFPANEMQIEMRSTSLIFKTAGSMPWGDVSPGGKVGFLRANGYCKVFNPFLQANPAYLNTFATIILTFKAGNHVGGFPSALITNWTYNNRSDGVPTWSLEAIGNYKFTNMANNFN